MPRVGAIVVDVSQVKNHKRKLVPIAVGTCALTIKDGAKLLDRTHTVQRHLISMDTEAKIALSSL